MRTRLFSRIYSNVLWHIAFVMSAVCVVGLPALASPTPGVDLSQVPTMYCGDGRMDTQYYYLYEGNGPAYSYSEGCPGPPGDWSYTFTSEKPISYYVTCLDLPNCDDFIVDALYGKGGTFTLLGPDGIMFTGEVTGGVASIRMTFDGQGFNEYGTLTLNLYGQWNDGSWSNAVLQGQPGVDHFVPQTLNFVPEPSTLVLLGSGILGLAGVLRRKFTS